MSISWSSCLAPSAAAPQADEWEPLACGLEQGTAAPESTEDLAIRRVPLTEAFRMVEAGEIRDAISIMSLQAVELLALKGRLATLLK